EAVDAQLSELSRSADSAFQAAMEAAGWHLHKREWRRRRGMLHSTMNAGLPNSPLRHHIGFALRHTLVDRFARTQLQGDALADPALPLDAHALMEQWYADLAGPFPTPVEEVLVERIVICKFNTLLADLDVELNLGLLDQPLLAGLERRRMGCHRRLLSALK